MRVPFYHPLEKQMLLPSVGYVWSSMVGDRHYYYTGRLVIQQRQRPLFTKFNFHTFVKTRCHSRYVRQFHHNKQSKKK